MVMKISRTILILCIFLSLLVLSVLDTSQPELLHYYLTMKYHRLSKALFGFGILIRSNYLLIIIIFISKQADNKLANCQLVLQITTIPLADPNQIMSYQPDNYYEIVNPKRALEAHKVILVHAMRPMSSKDRIVFLISIIAPSRSYKWRWKEMSGQWCGIVAGGHLEGS